MNKNIFFLAKPFRLKLDKKRAITLALIAFITFVVWFAQPASAAIEIRINSPSGVVNWAPGSHSIDFNVLTAGIQTDYNTSVSAWVYSGTTIGTKTNLLSAILPLFESINPDANSQGWIYYGGNSGTDAYTTTIAVDGAGSWSVVFNAGETYNATRRKYFSDVNLFDMNKNGGHITFYVRSNAQYQTIAPAQSVFYLQDLNCAYYLPQPLVDANNTWKQITLDLNGYEGANCSFEKRKVGSMIFNGSSKTNPTPLDMNIWIDGIRIYQNKNCEAFDGNQEKNTDCIKTITTASDVNGYITIAAQSGDTNAESSSGHFLFSLVDEENGNDLNRSDFNSLKFYIADSNTIFDFNASNTNQYDWYDFAGHTAYLEIVYMDSANTRTNKYFNSDILATDFANSDGSIRICVAKYQQFYQQIFVSTTETPIILYNQVADCYGAASYTEYAYGNALGLQATTINRPYTVYTILNGAYTSLSSLDGSLASVINLDALVFDQQKSSVSISNDSVSFGRIFYDNNSTYDENILQIHYVNLNSENASVTLKVYKADGNNFYSYTETASPNDFTLNWFFGGYGLTDANMLRLVVTKTLTAGGTKNHTIYFNISGTAKTGVLDAIVAIVFAMLLMLAGLTMFSTPYSLGWLGILLTLIAIGVLALAPSFWYIQLFQVVLLGIVGFIGLVWKNENAAVT